MFKFLLRGLLRDRSRSLFPVIIVAVGVSITVVYQALMSGFINASIDANAKFDAGHLKVMTRIYADRSAMRPNDLALTETGRWLGVLSKKYDDVIWLPRIKFAGLLDIPDAQGETQSQAPVMGMGLDLLSVGSVESANLGLAQSLVQGRLPLHSGEILVSDKLFKFLALTLGQKATLISSGMDNGMAVANFTVVGTVKFGMAAMDRGAVIADIRDMQKTLVMDDAAAEIIGLFAKGSLQDHRAEQIRDSFNAEFSRSDNKFSPVMVTLRQQGDFDEYLNSVRTLVLFITAVFIFVITLVFWNAGIRNGIRRYAEFGLRLAIGEDKRHLYISIIIEALCVGFIGSVIGTVIGLVPAWYVMHYGIDFGSIFNNAGASLLIPSIMRADITPLTLVIGFFPGTVATLLGTMMSAATIFRRQTTQLFKELEI